MAKQLVKLPWKFTNIGEDVISRLKHLSHIEATLETAFVCCGLFPSHFFSPLFEFLGNLCVQVWMVVHEGAKASEGMHGYTQV